MGSQKNAIPILIAKRGKLMLDRDAVRKVFADPRLHGKKICIVSISGSFRKGKSFMLNFFLRYVRNQGSCNEQWMGTPDTIINDSGFTSKGGRNPVTTGIVIHREIFTTKKDGEEIVILLMDTQGLFDGQMNTAKNCVVFALSTLLSSVQIYNLSQQIQDSDLQYLEVFSEYARAAREPHCRHTPFQTLTFLIRDWPHSAEIDYGMRHGAKYLDEILRKRSGKLDSVRSYLRKSFETTNCCLLPYPGEKVAETDHSLRLTLSHIDKKFLAHTKLFVHQILKPENLVVKCINGNPLDTKGIMQYLEDSMKTLDGGNLPSPDRMVETVASAQNLVAQQRSVKKYRKRFNEMFIAGNFYDDATLQDMHDQLHAVSLDYYTELTRFGGEEIRSKYLNYLLISLQREYQEITRLNVALKIASESKSMRLIERMAEEYEISFKEHHKISAEEYSEEKDLESLHTKTSSMVLDKYKGDKLAAKFPESVSQLEKRVERSFQKLKRDNAEARKVDEEKDANRRILLRKPMELILDFRKKIAQIASEYIEEHKLKVFTDNERKNAIDMYSMVLLEYSFPSDETELECANFCRRINDEIERFTQINEEKKIQLSKTLESQSNRIQLQYEESINSILEGGYMDKKELRKLHEEIVAELTENHKNQLPNHQISQQLVKEHIENTLGILENRFSDTNKLNEVNRTVFDRIFKILKSSINIIEVIGKAALVLSSIAALFVL